MPQTPDLNSIPIATDEDLLAGAPEQESQNPGFFGPGYAGDESTASFIAKNLGAGVTDIGEVPINLLTGGINALTGQDLPYQNFRRDLFGLTEEEINQHPYVAGTSSLVGGLLVPGTALGKGVTKGVEVVGKGLKMAPKALQTLSKGAGTAAKTLVDGPEVGNVKIGPAGRKTIQAAADTAFGAGQAASNQLSQEGHVDASTVVGGGAAGGVLGTAMRAVPEALKTVSGSLAPRTAERDAARLGETVQQLPPSDLDWQRFQQLPPQFQQEVMGKIDEYARLRAAFPGSHTVTGSPTHTLHEFLKTQYGLDPEARYYDWLVRQESAAQTSGQYQGPAGQQEQGILGQSYPATRTQGQVQAPASGPPSNVPPQTPPPPEVFEGEVVGSRWAQGQQEPPGPLTGQPTQGLPPGRVYPQDLLTNPPQASPVEPPFGQPALPGQGPLPGLPTTPVSGYLPGTTPSTNFMLEGDAARLQLQQVEFLRQELAGSLKLLEQTGPSLDGNTRNYLLSRIQELRQNLNISDPLTDEADRILHRYTGPRPEILHPNGQSPVR